MKDFFMTKSNQVVQLLNKGETIYPLLEVFINGRYAGAFSLKGELSIPLPTNEHLRNIFVMGYGIKGNETFKVQEEFVWRDYENQVIDSVNGTDYRAGDILVACDNVGGLPYGYMGHAAIVVDEKNIIEGVMSNPIIRKVPISQFIEYHPIYAQLRPRDEKIGKEAANYAERYLEQFQQNYKNGINKPLFYFTISTSLEDEWTYIYCSKLVWLCYHYGANYTFPNDHLWFAPEDLYTIAKNSKDFEIVYIHPDYTFFVDL